MRLESIEIRQISPTFVEARNAIARLCLHESGSRDVVLLCGWVRYAALSHDRVGKLMEDMDLQPVLLGHMVEMMQGFSKQSF